MPILDDFSGFEFEDILEDVFRNLGYENVRQAARTADEGRDIIMEEVVDGQRRGVVVECKHTDTVGRPVVQKLHSAISTFNFDGPKRGIVVTTGTFTNPAEEYATRLEQTDDPYPIELIDGQDLRTIADEVGLDLYNGRIEILCEKTLRPTDPTSSVDAPVREAFQDIENLDAREVSEPTAMATFQPVLVVEADTTAVFETSVGVIHRVNETNTFVVHADRSRPTLLNGGVAQLVSDNRRRTTDLDENAFADTFDEVAVKRFGQTETEYKAWAVDQLRDYHTTTVSYTGDNNVTYTKTCEPNQSDITIQSITPVYLPDIRHTTHIQDYTYPYEYYAAGPSRVTIEDGIHRCIQCGDEDAETFTYCANCGSINCASHIKSERVEGTPVCTGCAVTDRFVFKTKYFYSETNRNEFREQFDQMPLHEKAMENKPLVAGLLATLLVALIGILSTIGI